MFERLVKAIQANQISSIFLKGQKITSSQTKQLAEALKLNQSVTRLEIQDSKIEGDRNHLIEMLKMNKTLIEIIWWDCQLEETDLQMLCEGLKFNTSIVHIDFSWSNIRDTGAKMLSEILKINRSLTSIYLIGNKITDVGAQALFEILMLNQTLINLHLEDNLISPKKLNTIVEIIQAKKPVEVCKNVIPVVRFAHQSLSDEAFTVLLQQIVDHQIIEIDLTSKELSATQIKQMIKALENNHSVKIFKCGCHNIDDVSVQLLSEALINNCSVTALYLGIKDKEVTITDVGAKVLSEMLKINQTLKILDLHNHQIGDAGIEAFSAALIKNQTLTALYLRRGRTVYEDVAMADVGAKALSEMLKINQTLKILDLYNHKMTDEGITTISEALMENRSLTSLNLGCDVCRESEGEDEGIDFRGEITDEGAKKLSELLEINPTLIELNLQWNQISEEGAAVLAEALKINQTLKSLILNFNEIGDAGLQSLSEALKINHSIKNIELVRIEASNEGGKALAEALIDHPSLVRVDLGSNEIKEEGSFALLVAITINQNLIDFEGAVYAYDYDRDEGSMDSKYLEEIAKIIKARQDQIKATRNQTLLKILILLRHAYALEGYRWPNSQENLDSLQNNNLPADIWRLISHWLDFPSIQAGYRSSQQVAKFLSRTDSFMEFNQRLKTNDDFRLVEIHDSKIGESRFNFLKPLREPSLPLAADEIESPAKRLRQNFS